MRTYRLPACRPDRPTWYDTRRTCRHGVPPDLLPHIVVEHTSEQLADLQGADTGAERLGGYACTTTRAVSWHLTADSDSRDHLLADDATAWGARGYNRCAYHVEHVAQAAKWGTLPEWYRRQTIGQSVAGTWEGMLADHPARGRWRVDRPLTLAEVEAGTFGFVGHALLDPGRRSDPGRHFEWHWLLGGIRDLLHERTIMGIKVYAEGRDVATAMGAIAAFRLNGSATASLADAREAVDDGRLVIAFGGPAATTLFPDLADITGDGKADAGERRDGNRMVLIGATGGDTYTAGVRLAELAAGG